MLELTRAGINDGNVERRLKTSKKAARKGWKRKRVRVAGNKSAPVWEDADYEAVIPRIRRERRSGCADVNFAIGLCRVTVTFVDSCTRSAAFELSCIRFSDDSSFKRTRDFRPRNDTGCEPYTIYSRDRRCHGQTLSSWRKIRLLTQTTFKRKICELTDYKIVIDTTKSGGCSGERAEKSSTYCASFQKTFKKLNINARYE